MPKKKPHPLSRLRYYITLLASVVTIFSFFALLFLVPFVFDPAISTLSAGFPDRPTTCRLTGVRTGALLSSCNWTSCSEGCTAPLVTCVQLYVDVSHVPYAQYDRTPGAYDQTVWVMTEVPFKINIQSCGYPPHVNCTIFWQALLDAAKLGAELGGAELGAAELPRLPANATLVDRLQQHASHGGFPLPCYPSSQMPEMVIYSFDPGRELFVLVMSAVVPAVALLVSISFLCYCYCGWCRRSCPQLHIPGETDKPSMLPPELTVSMATSIADSK